MKEGDGSRVEVQGGGALIATPPHPAPAPARSGTPWAAVTTDHLQRLIPGVLGLHLAPGRPWQLPRHPKGGFFLGGDTHRQPQDPCILRQPSCVFAADPRRREPCPGPLQSLGARHLQTPI